MRRSLLLATLASLALAPTQPASRRAVPTMEQARANFDAALKELREAGEPTTADELAALVTPDHPRGRALLAIVEAFDAAALARQRDYEERNERVGAWPDSLRRLAAADAARLQEMRQWIDANPVWRDVRAAMRLAEGDRPFNWDAEYARPFLNESGRMGAFDASPIVGVLHFAANVNAEAVTLAHAEGRDDEAVALIGDGMRLAHAMRGMPLELSAISQAGIAARAFERAGHVAPTLHIGDGDGRASPQAVRELIALLLDDAPQREAMRFALRSGRVLVLQVVASERLAAASPSVNDAADIARLYGGLIRGVDAESRGAFKRQLLADFPWADDADDHLNYALGVRSKIARAAPSPTVFRSYHRSAAERRIAAVALAARLYAHDHNGALPPTLDDLVPKYLPAVPNDPMSLADVSLGYDPARGIVWSAGENGRDDGGNEGQAGQSLRELNQTTDIVYRLLTAPPGPDAPRKRDG